MEGLKVDFRKLNTDEDRKSYYAEVKSMSSREVSCDKSDPKPSIRPTNLKDKFEQYLKESCERQEILNEWMNKLIINTNLNLKNHDSSIKRLGKEQVVFKINKKEYPASISPIFVMNNLSGFDEFNEPGDLDDLVISDEMKGDLENYLENNDLLPDYENQNTNSRSLAIFNDDSSTTLFDPDKRMSIGLDDFVDIDDMWDDLDPGILTNKIAKTEFLKNNDRIHLHSPNSLQISCKIGYSGNNMVRLAKNLHVFIGCHQFLVDLIILENTNKFMEKGLTDFLFGKPFKEQVGLVEDWVKGTHCFKVGDDKTIFHMPRAEKAFRKFTVKQHNTMAPLLTISDEDKAKGIRDKELARRRRLSEVLHQILILKQCSGSFLSNSTLSFLFHFLNVQ
ncbi:hypothetical protein Tco_1104903 [Tanacetum coccineum]